MIKPNRILIVGGNAAGPAAAAKAKRVNPSAHIIMFESENYISTGTCEIPYVISDKIKSYEDIVYFSANSFKEKKGVDVLVNHSVELINRKEKTISVKDKLNNSVKEFSYDSLILSTGSQSRLIPGFDGGFKNLFTLKSISDLVKVKHYLTSNNVKRAVVIGSGYIGLEACEALIELGVNVTLLEKLSLPIPTAEKEISVKVKDTLSKNSVNFINEIPDIEPVVKEDKITAIKMGDEFIETDLVFLSIGFRPNTYLARQAKLEIGKTGAIKVDKKLRTSDRNIFAAGDNIEIINRITNKSDYFPLATYARDYGHIAGENAAGGNLNAEPITKNVSVKIFDSFYSSVGLSTLDAMKSNVNFKSVSAETYNLVSVMPESRKVFGKLLYDPEKMTILGASFFGGNEVSGYADLISSLIYTNQKTDVLSKVNYNYTPPLSPFTNLLYLLGKKATRN